MKMRCIIEHKSAVQGLIITFLFVICEICSVYVSVVEHYVHTNLSTVRNKQTN